MSFWKESFLGMCAGTILSSAKKTDQGSALVVSSSVLVWIEGMTGIVGAVVFHLRFLH